MTELWRSYVLAILGVSILGATMRAQQFAASQPLELASPLFFTAATLGDYDGDGDLDLAAGQTLLQLPRLFDNDGTGSFTDVSAALPNPGPVQAVQSLTFVDYDGDGDLDLFVSAMVGSYLLQNRGGGIWALAAPALPANLPPGAFVAGDFDSDGDQDLAGVGFALNFGRNQLLENLGNGTFVARDPFPGHGTAIAAADIDGDGDLDLYAGGPPRLWRNDGALAFTNVTGTRLPPLATTLSSARFGDLDGDGDRDLALTDSSGTADVVLRNLGNGTFVIVGAALPGNLRATRATELADVDHDGDLDLLRTRADLPPQLLRNDGTGHFTDDPGAVPAITAANALLLTGDLDGDGDDDGVLLSSAPTNWLLWNHHRHVAAATAPRRGQPWSVELWGQPGYGTGPRLGYLAIGLVRRPRPLAMPPFGGLWLDPRTPVNLTAALIQATAPATFTIAIPGVPQIAGVSLHVQGLVEESPGFVNVRFTSVVSTVIR